MGITRKTTNTMAQDRFIEEYLANGGFKLKACKKLNIAYSQVKVWFATDAAFCERVKEAESHWMDAIRSALMKRAMEKSDTAAFFFLKAHDPETYDDNVRSLKWQAEKNLLPDQTATLTVNLYSGSIPDGVGPDSEDGGA